MRIPPLSSLALSLFAGGLAAVLAAPAPSQGVPIGYEEEFALSTDRARALAELLPGTEEHYFYNCLHLQHEGRLAEVEPLLATWIERHGRTQRVVEIENRQALLGYEQDPAGTFDFLRRRLGLLFDDERQASGAKPGLATRLDPELISPKRLASLALQSYPGTFDGFRDSALEGLAAAQLDDEHLMSLLSRLRRPDVANLPALVARNLESKKSRGFGSLAIHELLLLDQLEECVLLRRALLDDGTFIQTYLRRLHPSPDVDWRSDAAEREAWLGRLQAFAERLSPAQNSLKAHVLHHRLAHDLALGKPDRERLLAYLRLPRETRYVRPEYLRRSGRGEAAVDPNAQYATELGPIGDDEPLVRAYLELFLRDADSWDAYKEYVSEDWLRRVFAETKILAGAEDRERWYSLLDDPAYYEQLKQRVEIEFAPTQRLGYGADEPVALDVDLKNVGTLIVKVFEIDTFNWYREQGREVDAGLDVDGLIPNSETTLTFEHGPLLRFRQRLELPELSKPGVFVVELIGNGLSSRAVVQKGRLQLLERRGSAGHVFRVLDEQGRVARDATLWFGGRELAPDEQGEILLPYTTEPGTKTLIARRGELCTLSTFAHLGEDYRLHTAVFLEREALLAGGRARLLVRPSLLLNGVPVGLELLEEPVLTLSALDQRGIASVVEVAGPTLSAGGELVHELDVPADLASLSVGLRARVRSLTQAQTLDLAAPARELRLNGMEATALTACPLLGRTAAGYVLDVRGKDGEPKADRAVQLALTHRDFTDPVHVTLQTDARGRVELGPLPGITALWVAGFPPEVGAFDLCDGRRTFPTSLHGTAGETLRVPYPGRATAASRAVLALLELRGGSFARDAFAHAAIAGGFVELRGLPAGDYELVLKELDQQVSVHVTAGEARAGWALGAHRRLELGDRSALAVTRVAAEGLDLVVQLANAGQDARVHVVATRYLPGFEPFASLLGPRYADARIEGVVQAESSYHSGREIGDEYRYILERRFARKLPGNMLKRPGLLLNPWALEETVTEIGMGGGAGGAFVGRRAGKAAGRTGAPASAPPPPGGAPGAFASLEFLPEGARLLANLRPDADGVVRVPLAELGQGQLVHVLALDRRDTVWTTLARAETPLVPRTRHLAQSLAPERPFAEQRRIELVLAGGTAVVEDVATADAEVVDSLAAVHRQFLALTQDADLAAFAFVLRWPELGPEEKRALYSKHACHELHFFLHEKDPAFFEEVVRPYLANKADKTFLDEWLLGSDLRAWLDPWAFERLNVVEKILLSRRIEGEQDAVARHVGDLCDLLPPDPERTRRLFETAMAGSALSSAGSFADELGKAAEYFLGRGEPSEREGAKKAASEPLEESVRAELQKIGYADTESDADLKDARDAERRDELRELFRMPEATRRYVESNYWHRRIEEQDGDLIRPNAFWRDWAEARGRRPFLSAHYPEAAGGFAEMLLALAVLDLPFEAAEHRTEAQERRLTLHAASPLLFVRKEIRAAGPAREEAPILVGQNYFRLDDRYRWEGNERRDAYVTDEFVTDAAYGCQVVVTNPTSTPRSLELLLQIPQGAIPLQRGSVTRGTPLRLEPYATASLEYAFYFPGTGTATHYPVQVSRDGELVAAAAATALPVVAEPTRVDTGSWDHVSQDGTSAEVLRWLDEQDLHRVDLGRIAWRLKERAFFDAALARLRRRHVYHDALWSYGLRHGEPRAAREYLRHAGGFLAQCGRWLASPLVVLDPVERRSFELVEYEPLFNPRAHRFGREQRILNADLAAQYGALLEILCYRPRLDDEDWLTVTYYLLLQDRVEEALAAFERVDSARLATRLQHDAMRAYLALYTEEHDVARAVAAAWRDHPVERWRLFFRDVLAQLDEAAGAAAGGVEGDDRTRRQSALAASEPALELEVEARRVVLRTKNVERCEVRYHQMDVELLFSTHPFVQQGSGSFAWVRPNLVEEHALPKSGELAFDLPERFRNANVLVEARAGGLVRRQAYYANSLAVELVESYGELRVAEAASGKPLPKVYVKVFSRDPGGDVRFHKDGYTDLRGRFDYVSLSGEGAGLGERYALLVLSEDHGAVIREAARPPR